MGYSARIVESWLREFLEEARARAKAESIDPRRLPPWLTAACIKYGWVHHTLVARFDIAAAATDQFEFKGHLSTDRAVLLDCASEQRRGLPVPYRQIPRPDKPAPIVYVGELGPEPGERTVLTHTGKGSFFEHSFLPHAPQAVFNLFLEWSPEGAAGLGVIRLVPFALLIHHFDVHHDARRRQMFDFLIGCALTLSKTEAGDYYAGQAARATNVELTKKRAVLVLGKYSGDEGAELLTIRDLLCSGGYDAYLLKDLPEIPCMSNEEKARHWALAARFCVMVDRVAGGQLAEFAWLKDQRTILALLHPVGGGSTSMIGKDVHVDYRFVRVFEFEDSTSTVLQEAIQWAEGQVSARERAHDAEYPWRSGTARASAGTGLLEE